MTKRSFILALLIFTNCYISGCGGGSGQATETGNVASSSDPISHSSGSTYVPVGSSDWPLFVYPQPGDPNIDTRHPVQWTAANNARGYELQIGTTLGGNDVFDSGVITTTSVTMPPLPAGTVIYARVRAVLNGWGDGMPAGHWPRGSYTRFRTDDQTPASTFTNISTGATLAVGKPIEWSASPLAVGYRVTVTGGVFGEANGIFGSNGIAYNNQPIYFDSTGRVVISGDSGVIHTTHVFINAPIDSHVTAKLDTIYLTRTVSTQLTFTIAGGAPSFADKYELVKKLTAEVRSMADRDNQPYAATILDTLDASVGSSNASCEQFMLALIQLIGESRVGLAARQLDIGLQENRYDSHTLVEVLDDTSSRWVTFDPTFGLITLRSDGVPATAAEISAAVRALNWSALDFSFLTAAGDQYVRDYYIDYPLLFVDIQLPNDSKLVQSAPATLEPYFDSLPLPISDASQEAYAMKCPSGFDSVTADVDDAAPTMPCGGGDGLTRIFWAYNIQAQSGSNGASEAWRLRRFIF